MADWADGYVTNMDYTSGFYPGLSPLAQNFSLLYRGYATPSLADGFSYCELGCGHGFSTALLAAANPQGAFWGIDFNPTHIASAQQLKRAGDIENVTFLEQSFAEALKADLPRFDYIALHGVWSWISRENRQAIVDFIYAKLNPGGVVYISYNALPGWAAAAPLRQLMVERLRGQGEPTPDAIGAAIAFAQKLRDANAGYFAVNAQSGKRLDAIAAMSRNYLAHEYLNRDWSPAYHSDVVADLSAAKLGFAAASGLVEQMDPLVLPPQANELLKEVTDQTARETIRDYFMNTQFRRDLFVRGARLLPAAERNDRLLATRVVLMRTPPPLPFKVRVPLGEVTIEANPAQAVFEILAEGPCMLGEILKDRRVESSGGGNAAFQTIAILMAVGAILPALGPEDQAKRRESTARFNRAALARLGTQHSEHTLASPLLGTGLTLPPAEQMLLLTASGPTPAIEQLMQVMIKRPADPKAGEPPLSPDQRRADLEKTLGEFRRDRLPVYQRLGLV